jgi:hypothetical protein
LSRLSTGSAQPALRPQNVAGSERRKTDKGSAMKSQQHTETQPRRMPVPELQVDKGRKHEAFESAPVGGDRRSVARAMRFDRKR